MGEDSGVGVVVGSTTVEGRRVVVVVITVGVVVGVTKVGVSGPLVVVLGFTGSEEEGGRHEGVLAASR